MNAQKRHLLRHWLRKEIIDPHGLGDTTYDTITPAGVSAYRAQRAWIRGYNNCCERPRWRTCQGATSRRRWELGVSS